MPEHDLLQSWKEIAAYLGRSERTCRRWETEFALPVHRMDGSVRGSVFAYKSEVDRWMGEILHDEEEPSPDTSRRRPTMYLAIILLFATILAVAVAFVVFRMGRPEPRPPPSSNLSTLAILPFVNNTGDENLDFWENALADLLVSDLSQSRYLTVLPEDGVLSILRDLDLLDAENIGAIDLEKVASRARVENIVVGSFIKVGQQFRISATVRCMSSGEGVVLPSTTASSEEEILPRIDELSAAIKNQILRPFDSTSRDIDLDTGSITTSSIDAYRYYIDGRLSLLDGRAAEAMESLKMAVAIDPEFATAYKYLAMCFRSLPGYEDEAEEALSRAFELSHRASLRERFHIQAYYYRSRGPGSWGQYLKSCQEWVKVYPDDDEAYLFLGEAYFRLEEFAKSIESYESIGSSHPNLVRAHRAMGQYKSALEVARAAAPDSDSLEYRHQLVLSLIYERRFERALLEADKVLERFPGDASALMAKGDVHFYRGEWDQAEEYYRELLNPVGSDFQRMRSHRFATLRLANLYFSRGQFERALDLLTAGIDEVTALGEGTWLLVFRYPKATILLAQGDLSGADVEIQFGLKEAERRDDPIGKVGNLQLRGRELLRMGDVGEADRVADEIRAEIDGWTIHGRMREWHDLAGRIDLARNDVDSAVEHFERAVSLVPSQNRPDGDEHAVYYASLAYSYYLSGNLAKAQEWYENILSLTTGRLWYGDIFAKSHFMLGKIYEQRGMNEEAVRSYRSFLDLWREADASAPDIEEARRALADLLN